MIKKKKKSEHYVNNKDFLDAIIQHKMALTSAKELDQPKPIISRYIGECFLKIATHL